MISSASLAFSQLFTQPFRSVLWKTLGITLLLLALIWALSQAGLAHLLTLEDFLPGWAETVASIIAGLSVVFGLWFLIVPVSAVVASLFLDDISEVVEHTHYPMDTPGRSLGMGEAMIQALRFLGVVLLVNIVVLMMVPLLGLGFIIFFPANGYLLGREYFEQAALRFRSPAEVKELRAKHGAKIFLCGLVIAGFIAVPILNLLTPLFATAFMVHVHKRLSGSRPINTDIE
ncbi:MAG: sulfate transporter family protein [Cohaesibacter sp.]|jgi:CysZ protein|nr:sulfate transporter family protein [Cohaesibacter sp.]